MTNKFKTLVFIVCYIAYTGIYVARLNLSMASPGLIESFILNTAQVGMLGSIFSIVYSVGRLLNGYISDKQPPWLMLSTGLALAGIANIFIGNFPPFIGILLLWGVNAFAQSMLWSSILRLISSMYDEATAKRKTSYMVTSVATGNIVGILLNTFIINTFGLEFSFIIPGALTLIFGAVIIPVAKRVECPEKTASKHLSMISLLKNQDIKTVTGPALLHGMMKDNISLWMTVFIVDRYNIDLAATAGFVLFIPILGFAGRMVYPLFYKLCSEKEHKVSVYAFAACIFLSIPLCFKMIPAVVAIICLSLIYTAVSIINTSILSIFPIQFAKTGNIASVSGIMDFATYFGAGISSLAYGFLIENFGYTPMYASWAVISLLSVFILRKMMK